jgi:anti-sigma B factor antagonist
MQDCGHRSLTAKGATFINSDHIFGAYREAGRGAIRMVEHRRVEVAPVGEVTVVRFLDRKILDAAKIQELGEELFSLVGYEDRRKLLLNFANVEFLSSAALNKLIILEKKVKADGGRLVLSDLRPEIHEVFVITRLTQLFEIKENEAGGLAALA